MKYVAQLTKCGMLEILRLLVTDTIKKVKPLRAVYGNIDDDKARLEFR
jgi:hypothetical protein